MGHAHSIDAVTHFKQQPLAQEHPEKGHGGFDTGSVFTHAGLTSGKSAKSKGKVHLPHISAPWKGVLRGLEKLASGGSHAPGQKRRILWTESVKKDYFLHSDTLPSGHVAMAVRPGIRISDNTPVVVKIRRKKKSFCSPSEEQQWRSTTEFMLNMPQCKNIVQLFEVLEDSNNYYVVMEKASGMDLFEVLSVHGRLPMRDSREVARGLICAVASLHEQGCIHKDLKLENVMVDCTPSRRRKHGSRPASSTSRRSERDLVDQLPIVKLIDFDTVEPACDAKQQAKSVVGTDQYIAQEAYAGEYSTASDVFAVGVILYRLLTGTFPFKPTIFSDEPGENWVGCPKMDEIREKLKGCEVDFSRKPFSSEPLARDLVQRMLAVEQSDRPTAAEALQHPWLTGGSLRRSDTHETQESIPITAVQDTNRPSVQAEKAAQGDLSTVSSVSKQAEKAALDGHGVDTLSPPGAIDC